MRIIDADALVKQLKEDAENMQGLAFQMATSHLIGTVENQPTIDPGVDEWCPDCKEYDSKRHMCPRFNRVIRDTLNEVKAAQKEEK